MKNLSVLILVVVLLVVNTFVSYANTKQDIEKANKKGNVVFLVVTDKGNIKNQEAMTLAKNAQKTFAKSTVLELDRGNVADYSLVKEYGLAGAPVPLILVIAKNGFVVGGAPLQGLTVDDIVQMIPTPKLEDLYASVAKGKHAIIVFSKKAFADKNETIKNSKEAVSMLNGEAVYIEVDMDDPKEANFTNKLGIDKSQTKASITLVVNKQGQVAGTSTTIPDPQKLVTAAKTPVKGGCGPGCGPAGCGK